MQAPISLTIIHSTYPVWPHVRAALAAHPHIDVVADIDAAHVGKPGSVRPSDVVLAAAGVGAYHPVALHGAIRRLSPDSALIFLGPMADLEGAALLVLHEHGVRGYLVWEDVRGMEVIVQAIMAIQAGNLLISSPAVAATYRAALERRRRPRVDGLVLTPGEWLAWVHPTTGRRLVLSARDQAVLRHLVQGHKHRQIAQMERISVRTVENHVAILKEEFDVATTTMLVVLAERWGIVPE